jgi:hypothetical protein
VHGNHGKLYFLPSLMETTRLRPVARCALFALVRRTTRGFPSDRGTQLPGTVQMHRRHQTRATARKATCILHMLIACSMESFQQMALSCAHRDLRDCSGSPAGAPRGSPMLNPACLSSVFACLPALAQRFLFILLSASRLLATAIVRLK